MHSSCPSKSISKDTLHVVILSTISKGFSYIVLEMFFPAKAKMGLPTRTLSTVLF